MRVSQKFSFHVQLLTWRFSRKVGFIQHKKQE
ncbi:hypothetical protein D918_08271 [Trichuris suis]|nr:hypothetical protein D918_08271 [Trichuris suis]